MSLATELIKQVLTVAEENNARRVDEVEVQTGILQQVIPEAMQIAFEAVTQGTIAQGAKLTLHETSAKARCRACQTEYEPDLHDFLCPQCHKADAEILTGNEIVLKSIVCQTAEGASSS